MTYEQSRRHEIRSNIIRVVNNLVNSYDPNKKTVILLPGGMGSHLERTTSSYKPSKPGPFKNFETLWIDIGIIFTQDALKIGIQKNNRDKDSHIIVANGPLEFFAKPYDGTEKYFKNKGFNFAVFGYDWRRPIQESAAWFEFFLKEFKKRVIKRFKKDTTKNPLPSTTVLCHSMGGLVAKLFLNRISKHITNANSVNNWMEQMITVATPFYGTSNHIRRYFKGIDSLNRFYSTDKITSLAASLEGPYILMYLDKDSYDEDEERLELERYPSFDANNESIKVDPYAKETINRYPLWVNMDFLKTAKSIRRAIRKELPEPLIDRVFHIRGVKKDTWIEILWAEFDRDSFDPGSSTYPISGKDGKGDGTVPFWSARLAQSDDKHTYDLRIAKDHGSIMEHEETLKVAHRIIETGVCPEEITAQDKHLGIKEATDTEVKRFLKDVEQNRINIKNKISTDPNIWRTMMDEVAFC